MMTDLDRDAVEDEARKLMTKIELLDTGEGPEKIQAAAEQDMQDTLDFLFGKPRVKH